MTVLRSRKLENVPKSDVEIEPLTPTKKAEVINSTPNSSSLHDSCSGSNQGLRRSSRLSNSSSFEFVEITPLQKRRKSTTIKNGENVEGNVMDTEAETKSGDSFSRDLNVRESTGNRSLTLRSGKKLSKTGSSHIDVVDKDEKLSDIKSENETEEKEEGVTVKTDSVGSKTVVSNDNVPMDLDVKESGSVNNTANKSLKLRSGKKLSLSKPEVSQTVDEIVMDQMEMDSGGSEKVEKVEIDGTVLMELDVKECKKLRSGKKLSKPGASHIVDDNKPSANENEKENFKEGEIEGSSRATSRASRKFSSEDKKKGVLVYDEEMEIKMENDVNGVQNASKSEKGKGKISEVVSTIAADADADSVNMEQINRKKEMYKNLARENALKFAHFSLQTEPVQENIDVDEEELELPMDANGEVEDWPGPFSTAMKIIRDRAENIASGQKFETFSKKNKSVPLIWVPKEKKERGRLKKPVPSLQDLCMGIISENVDAITSLESVPDVIRHKLSHLLCKSRKMNSHFFDLLASGSPYEIRVRDCSWINEEQLSKSLEKADTSNLMVLQLDQSGRCLPDYVLYSSLTNLPNKLSALTNISLKGACRLSDAGLTTLVSNASALRSINLGCCSLLTCDGIISLADKLGPVLKELYIDECFGIIDAKSILPALLKLQNLEVLSISHFESVNDSFIIKFVTAQGQKMKELILADCTKLTDKALKAIAENCTGLCAIDLTNLRKLTDASLGHLANGCQSIQTMKLRRNAFSDESVAAYLEACGRPLVELSLNHVDEVSHHTAISLAKHGKNLQHLDLSWCREMTDEALGLIVDSCLSLKIVKLFGCTQITEVFTDGHSNEVVKVVGLKETPLLKNIEVPDFLPLRYSPV